MNNKLKDEIYEKIYTLISQGVLDKKNIYFFGHCNITEKLIDFLLEQQYSVAGILDNNIDKQGAQYRGVSIVSPISVEECDSSDTVVIVASRAYPAMAKQLKEIGYNGQVVKVVDYNSFSEYSLSFDVVQEKNNRLAEGLKELEVIKKTYENKYLIVCPYAALGDVYYAMAYLPFWLVSQSVQEYVVITVGSACRDIAKMFGVEEVISIEQNTMDKLVQAILYSNEQKALIAHHDRPYTSELIKALNYKCISFESFYRSGVFGLKENTVAYAPGKLEEYKELYKIKKGRTVIISPYAKSVANISVNVWDEIVNHYLSLGYSVFTNVVGEEQPIKGTEALNVPLTMIQSLVEYSGTFIGVRSGLCDVIKNAKCKKIALYPDCYYSNTKWKVIDFFKLEEWENILI